MKGFLYAGRQDYVLSVASSHDGKWAVSSSKDCGVMFWNSKTGIPHCMIQGHKSSVLSIGLSPTSGCLATGGGDWQTRICEFPLFVMYRTANARLQGVTSIYHQHRNVKSSEFSKPGLNFHSPRKYHGSGIGYSYCTARVQNRRQWLVCRFQHLSQAGIGRPAGAQLHAREVRALVLANTKC